jgi:hypothetical protein
MGLVIGGKKDDDDIRVGSEERTAYSAGYKLARLLDTVWWEMSAFTYASKRWRGFAVRGLVFRCVVRLDPSAFADLWVRYLRHVWCVRSSVWGRRQARFARGKLL